MTPDPIAELKALLPKMPHAVIPVLGEPCFHCVLSTLIPQIEREMEAAVAAEREACLMVFEACLMGFKEHDRLLFEDFESAKDHNVKEIIHSRGSHDALNQMLRIAGAEAVHKLNQQIGECLQQDANSKSTAQMLGAALADAEKRGYACGRQEIFAELSPIEMIRLACDKLEEK